MIHKIDAFKMLYESEPCVRVYARSGETITPETLRRAQALLLELGRGLPVPVADLTFDDRGFSGTFNCSGQATFLEVGWDDVFQMSAHMDHQNPKNTCVARFAWPGSPPPEAATSPSPARKNRPAYLRLVTGADVSPAS